MTRTNQDFEMWSGDHKNLQVTVYDGDGASIDLSGASVIWLMSEGVEGASLLKRSTDSGCGISVSGSTFTVSLSPTHTSGSAGTLYHEAQVRDGFGNISTVMTGHATIHVDAITDA